MSIKSILIVKRDDRALAKAEEFLKHRGWTVVSTTNIKTAVDYALMSRPTIALISIDHPDSRIQNLCDLLQNSYGVTSIKFTESNSIRALNMLVQEKKSHAIRAIVTGPAIERAIHQALSTPPSKTTTTESLIRQCSLSAFLEVFSSASGAELKKPKDSGTLGGLMVESSKFSGVFVTSMGFSQFKESFTRFTKYLARQFRSYGEPLSDFKALTLPTDWNRVRSVGRASSLYLSGAINDLEIEMMFFETEPMLNRLRVSNIPGLLSCPLDWIESETELGFNLLIYLKTNQKTLTYIRKGDVLTDEAKQRLQNHGVQSVYIQDSEVDQFYGFHALNVLRRHERENVTGEAVS